MKQKMIKICLLSIIILMFLVGCSPAQTRGRLFNYLESGDYPIVPFVKKEGVWLGVFHLNPPREVKTIKIKAKYVDQHQWKTKELADIQVNIEENQGALDLVVSYDINTGEYYIHYSPDYIEVPPKSVQGFFKEVGQIRSEYQVVEGDVWLDTQKEYMLMGNGGQREDHYQISREFDAKLFEKEEGNLFFVIECVI